VKAFKTLLSNVLRVIAINTVGDFVIFLGKVLVMAGNVIIAFFLFNVSQPVQYNDLLPDLAV